MAPNKPLIPVDDFQEIPPLFLTLLRSRVFLHGCVKCGEIIELEARLDKETEKVVEEFLADIRPIREENNRRWEKFAKICRFPVIGNLYFRIFNRPKLLEEPFCSKHPAYLEARNSIEPTARKLEELKKNDMEHWGHESVDTNDGMYADPDPGYSREQCYEKGFHPFLPDKYDFNSAAGVRKFEEGKLVMCCVTKKLFPISQCAARYGEKVFYFSRNHQHLALSAF